MKSEHTDCKAERSLQEFEALRNSPDGKSANVQGLLDGKGDAVTHTPRIPKFDGSALSSIRHSAYIEGYGESGNVSKVELLDAITES